MAGKQLAGADPEGFPPGGGRGYGVASGIGWIVCGLDSYLRILCLVCVALL